MAIDIETIGFEVDAMIDQAKIETMSGKAQAIGSCVAVALGFDPWDIEACNLSDLAASILNETQDGDRDLHFVIRQTIVQCASVKLDRKATRSIMFADANDSNLMSSGITAAAGCNPISMLASLIFGGVRQLMIYPSTRGLGRRFTAGVTTVAIKNCMNAKGKK